MPLGLQPNAAMHSHYQQQQKSGEASSSDNRLPDQTHCKSSDSGVRGVINICKQPLKRSLKVFGFYAGHVPQPGRRRIQEVETELSMVRTRYPIQDLP
jgi:hypothetical protein